MTDDELIDAALETYQSRVALDSRLFPEWAVRYDEIDDLRRRRATRPMSRGPLLDVYGLDNEIRECQEWDRQCREIAGQS